MSVDGLAPPAAAGPTDRSHDDRSRDERDHDERAGPRYDEAWLDRYERLRGTDALIADAEMAVVEDWYLARFGACAADRLRHLDLGTCTGRYLRWSRARGVGLCCGVDASADATRFCEPLREPGRVVIERADFLQPEALPRLGERHGPFHLVTVMMGTINHVSALDQTRLLQAIGRIMAPSGRLLVSSWRPGSQVLSLYRESDRRRLTGTPLRPDLRTGLAETLGLRWLGSTATAWQDVVEFAPLAGRGTAPTAPQLPPGQPAPRPPAPELAWEAAAQVSRPAR